MDVNSWTMYYTHTKQELRSPERLHDFVTRLISYNCYLSVDTEINFPPIQHLWLIDKPEEREALLRQLAFIEALKPDISEGLNSQIRQFVQQSKDTLIIKARVRALSSFMRGFEFKISIVPEEQYLLLSIEHKRFFDSSPEGHAKYRYWLAILAKVYTCWQPLFAHESATQGPPAYNITSKEVVSLRIPCLYNLNIYGHELVRQIGRQRLLDTPAWLVRELEPHGCLIIPEDSYKFTSNGQYTYNQVAQHLGFPLRLWTQD